ncbi:hypothetical protein BJ166DRAFT_598296 [Pestalotiopsis sp. NC0098]|nr:hypothetical protein BJ166DRAFT_598296 [Pestalotiopsis sp. NC0098]
MKAALILSLIAIATALPALNPKGSDIDPLLGIRTALGPLDEDCQECEGEVDVKFEKKDELWLKTTDGSLDEDCSECYWG